MRRRLAPGEVGLASIFAITGIVWTAGAMGLPLWEGFAPESGFLPLIYGILLAGLSVVTVTTLLWDDSPLDPGPISKPLLVLAALVVTVVGLEVAGFSFSMFFMLLFLYAVVEKLPLVRSLLAAGGTTTVLFVLFKSWLGVPLPLGPLGI